MPSDLPGDLTGTHALAAWLNKLKRAVARRTPLPGLGYKLKQNESGFVHEIIPGGGTTAPAPRELQVRRYTISGVFKNYLQCSLTNVVGGEAVYFVAKPPHLLETIASEVIGNTTVFYEYLTPNQRQATAAPNDVEFQRILPAYEIGGEVWGASGEGTDVLRNDPTDTDAPSPAVELTIMDLNIHARAWASATIIPIP